MSALPATPSREAELLEWLSARGWATGAQIVRWGVGQWHDSPAEVRRWLTRWRAAGLLVGTVTVRHPRQLEYRVAGVPPVPTVSPPASPWQVLVDALRATPCRVWTEAQLLSRAECDRVTARACLARAQREGLVVAEGAGWRLADVRGAP